MTPSAGSETARGTAADEGAGFVLPEPVQAVLLLQALKIGRAMWPLVLAPFQNTFPKDPAQMTQLMASIRQQGHLVEGTHAGPKSLRGAFLRNDGGASSAHYFGEDGGGDHAPDDQWNFASGPSYTAEQSQDRHEEVYYDEDGWQACSTCGSFAYPTEHNDDNDTDTESEADVEQMDTEEYKAYLGDMEGYGYDDLKTEYFFAKRRFRSFARRPPRRSRFPRASSYRKRQV